MLFTPFKNKKVILKNRVVRSATADPEIYAANKVTQETIDRYKVLAENNIGMIITGDFPVTSEKMLTATAQNWDGYDFKSIQIKDVQKIPCAVHETNPENRIVAQLTAGNIMRIPSLYQSPFGDLGMAVLCPSELRALALSFAAAALEYKKAGFDGIQIHAAHGGALSLMLSPLTNTRDDKYGEPTEIFREIIREIRIKCHDFLVLIKLNCTDYMPKGLGLSRFHQIAHQLSEHGYDGIEVSGGIWDCLHQSEETLGFPPRPSAESHTNLSKIENQSYFRPFVKNLSLPIPVILVGGNFNRAICDDILKQRDADLISFCRPLICEPDLMTKWALNEKDTADCKSCNACLYELYEQPDGANQSVRCVFKTDKQRYKEGIIWGKEWVKNNFHVP